MVVEPRRFVLREARGKDLCFPSAGRRLEALQLPDQLAECFGPLHPRVHRDPLPIKKETQKVARGDRLDLRAQSLHRIPVDPGEQPALAPFIDRCARGEAPAHGEAFCLERRKRSTDILRLKPERIGQGSRRDGSLALEPAPNEFDEGRLGRHFLLYIT